MRRPGCRWPRARTDTPPSSDVISVSLATFMESIFAVGSIGRHLVAQVVATLGCALDSRIAPMGMAADKLQSAQGVFELTPVEDGDPRFKLLQQQRMLQYWAAGIDASRTEQMLPFSFAHDATRVGGKPLQTMTIIHPSNIAHLAPLLDLKWSQELRDYQGKTKEKLEAKDKAGVAEDKQDYKVRSLKFLQNKWGQWRPKPVKRQKTFQTILSLDSQLRAATLYDGFDRLRQPLATEDRNPDPFSWPLAASVSDQAPDLVCGLGYLRRAEGANLNLDVVWGVSHGLWNDLKAGIKFAGLWGHECLFICSVNMRYGCWQQEARLRQLRESYDEYLQMMDGTVCPLLDDLMDRLLSDFDRAAEAGIAEKLFEKLGELDLWSKAGSRITLNRFLQAVRVSVTEDKVWTARLHSQLYCCLQEDMFHGEAFRKHYEKIPVTVAQGNEGKANVKELNEELRAVKASCRNLLILSTIFLYDADNQIRQRIIVAATTPYEHWHTVQNTKLRSANATLPWMIHDDPQAVMNVLEARLGQQSEEAELNEGLMQVDEGFELLKEDERQEVRKTQAEEKNAKEARQNFVQKFTEKKREILSMQMPKKRRKTAAVAGMMRKKLPMCGEIEQSVAKQYIPQTKKCSIWKSNKAGGWCGEYKPFMRFTRLILHFGSDREALIATLQELWRSHFTLTGESEENCPIADLFTEPDTDGRKALRGTVPEGKPKEAKAKSAASSSTT